MRSAAIAELVAGRLDAAGLMVPGDSLDRLVVFVELLARWNRKVNLTAFDLTQPTPPAIDRLIVEAVRASVHVRATDKMALDIGSGGGSPAVPLMICAPQLRMVLVESRERKGAFLREAIRSVLGNGTVEVCRLEDYSGREASARFDLISMRAVRADRAIWAGIERLMAVSGRMLWFGAVGQKPEIKFPCRLTDVGGDLIVVDRLAGHGSSTR